MSDVIATFAFPHLVLTLNALNYLMFVQFRNSTRIRTNVCSDLVYLDKQFCNRFSTSFCSIEMTKVDDLKIKEREKASRELSKIFFKMRNTEAYDFLK